MSDYYEPHPRFWLSRPVVVAGQLGCGARLIGRTLSARTGLPFAEIDRSIEHEAGSSLMRIAVEAGTGRVASLASAALQRIAQQRPFGVIVLDHAWPGMESAPLLHEEFDVVYVVRSRRYLFEQLSSRPGGVERWLLGERPEDIVSEDDLAPLHRERAAILDASTIRLDAGCGHALDVADELFHSLEVIEGARAL